MTSRVLTTASDSCTTVVDTEINPYEIVAEKYEPASMATSKAPGEQIEAHRDRPVVTLSKWNGDARMIVGYDIKRGAAAPCSPTASSWKGATQEMHAYPLQPREGMDDGGFEIEIILQEKSNVFAFRIEDAHDLDFFDWPKLSPEENSEGTVRPENVIGSYAVYPKTKTNHRVDDTL